MPTYRAPLQEYAFILNDYLNVQQYKDIQGFGEAAELISPLLQEGARLCEEVLFPLNQSGDKEGLKWENGRVITPQGFSQAYRTYVDGGWPAMTCDPAYGGQGLPEVIAMPMVEMICSANLSFGLTPGLTHAFYNALAAHGTEEQKRVYMPNIISGKWSGVMDLTEPQAGTDLGLIRTKAEPNADGSWNITGTKIFISSGEQDLTENIIHLVLARTPDAPEGIKGISLFIVPKILVNGDGSLGERNKVECSGIEHKMGIHASPTCVINFDNAKGWLIGPLHKGVRSMFTMMNAARIYVGVQGLGVAEAAWQSAKTYAHERLQSRHISGAKMPEKAADPIVLHPDVRRMLLVMRSFCEGARAFCLETALMHDLSVRHPDATAREEADAWVQLMTPILKSYFTDMGSEVANLAIQVYGGHGYIREHGVEQYARDARITQIYEGTNGIQALDLVGRKLSYRTGRYLRSFFHPLDRFITEHQGNEKMAEFIKPLKKHVGYLHQASAWIALKGFTKPEEAAAGAVEYQRMFALVVMAYTWAKIAAVALTKLEQGAGEAAYYNDKLATARFYMARVLPGTVSLLMCLTAGNKTLAAAEV